MGKRRVESAVARASSDFCQDTWKVHGNTLYAEFVLSCILSPWSYVELNHNEWQKESWKSQRESLKGFLAQCLTKSRVRNIFSNILRPWGVWDLRCWSCMASKVPTELQWWAKGELKEPSREPQVTFCTALILCIIFSNILRPWSIWDLRCWSCVASMVTTDLQWWAKESWKSRCESLRCFLIR